MAGIEEGPMNEAELQELEVVMERHKELGDDNYGDGVFSSICILGFSPRSAVSNATSRRPERSGTTRSRCSAT